MHDTLSEIAGLAAFSIRYKPRGCMVILNCGLFHTDTRFAHRGRSRYTRTSTLQTSFV